MSSLQSRPRAVRDTSALRSLAECIGKASAAVAAFGTTPCVIAEATHKFNDAWYDDVWQAIQIGSTYWEQSQYFEDRPKAALREHSWSSGDLSRDEMLASGSRARSVDIDTARSILRVLQTSRWRDLASAVFPGNHNLTALVLQYDQTWICRSTPNGSGYGDVWVATPDGGFLHVATCDERLDQEIGFEFPLQLLTIVPDHLASLSTGARDFFLPSVRDRSAFDQLAQLLHEVEAEVKRLTREPVALSSQGFFDRTGEFFDRCRTDQDQFVWGREWFSWTHRKSLRINPKTRSGEPYPEEVYQLSELLTRLKDADWRGLFGQAFGRALRRGQSLCLHCGATETALVRENTKFGLDGYSLQDPVICQRASPTQAEAPETLS